MPDFDVHCHNLLLAIILSSQMASEAVVSDMPHQPTQRLPNVPFHSDGLAEDIADDVD